MGPAKAGPVSFGGGVLPEDDLLIEPLGFLHGAAARIACDAGAARWLAGGGTAFTLCRLIGPVGTVIVPIDRVPAGWSAALDRLLSPVPSAGLPGGALVMGILNVTPDSFSDGGRHLRPEAAVEAGLRMRDAGADLIDVGGESTRPGADPVSAAEEQDRVLPVIKRLRDEGVRVSIDSRNAATMHAALRAGATLVNDVSALGYDPDSTAIVAEAGCSAVLMHMRGTPQTMTTLARYDDVAVSVVRSLARSVEAAVEAGIRRDRLLVDPGIGFAKTTGHNLDLLARLPLLLGLGCRIVLGASRKRFIGEVAAGAAPLAPTARDPGSIAAALSALSVPDIVLRVHDVPGTVQAMRVWQAINR